MFPIGSIMSLRVKRRNTKLTLKIVSRRLPYGVITFEFNIHIRFFFFFMKLVLYFDLDLFVEDSNKKKKYDFVIDFWKHLW